MKRSSKEIVSPETDENYVAKYMVWGKNIVVVLVQKKEEYWEFRSVDGHKCGGFTSSKLFDTREEAEASNG